ncbi:hypothetical protein AVEN_84901-1 [Araneus ventricosus]|uniref:CCHC-type domain-containing protein n=1 Tax=Araneus ventricosus TaxID=182803 RepID=A0A4Y2NXG8_ARAVE|nr:hypothetical protein AVEN_84901-1 [Araneus ventricosus]
MITDHIKRRVSPEVKDHFLDEWGKIVDPSELAGKLDENESVRSASKQHFPKALERKPVEKIRPVSPKGELKEKPLGNSGPSFRKNSTPKGNWRNENFESRNPAACYICHSTEHLRPNCPQLKNISQLKL